MLEIKNLCLRVSDSQTNDQTTVVKNINLTVRSNALIMGKNGSGKSSLFKGILKYPRYVHEGQIFFGSQDISDRSTYEIACLGLMMSCQHPIPIPGLTLMQLLIRGLQRRFPQLSTSAVIDLIDEQAAKLQVTHLLDRHLNGSLSGGEFKRSELLQLSLFKPSLVIYDELEAGVDIESIRMFSSCINSWDHQKIFISHTIDFASAFDIEHVILISDGSVRQEGGRELAEKIQAQGFTDLSHKRDS